MSSTAIIIIVLVACMALGPVFLLQPSRRQRQLANYRSTAAREGLKVGMSDYMGDSVATYTLRWPQDSVNKFAVEPIHLTRKEYKHELHIADYWQVNGKIASPQLSNQLTDILQAVPESVVGMDVNNDGVALWWKETGGEQGYQSIKQLLESSAQALWPMVSAPRKVVEAD